MTPGGSDASSAADRDGPASSTYAGAGVDIAAGEHAVDLIKPLVAATLRPEVIGGLGGFGGLVALDTDRYRRPVLGAGTVGVGTKAVVALDLGRFDPIGIDLVAMCVDDLVCQGAEPLFFLDYISCGMVEPSQMAELVAGVAEGCRQVGAALIGGEMAEHPGVMKPGEFDLVGFAVGVVERDEALGPHRVRPGDVLIGLASPGLRCNGYSLARQVLSERSGVSLTAPAWPGAAVSLADELIRPSVIYTPAVRAAIAAAQPRPDAGGGSGVHAVAHITGGGLEGNVPRSLPDGLHAVVDRGTWEVPAIFGEIRRLGNVAAGEMARVFNLGLGMVMMVDPASVDDVLGALAGADVGATVVGRVDAGRGGLEFVGPGFWPASDDPAPSADGPVAPA
ncbi:MAG: phosphoribosylformylglycinamidine cyclo-ligase [Acidimicrobiales bacterium]